jgi:hypothetical protein
MGVDLICIQCEVVQHLAGVLSVLDSLRDTHSHLRITKI